MNMVPKKVVVKTHKKVSSKKEYVAKFKKTVYRNFKDVIIKLAHE